MHLLEYDTIIFDLDFTIWDGCRPRFWAKLLKPPYSLGGNSVYGINGDFIQLQIGVEKMLFDLWVAKKKLGFASIGAVENIDFDEQPSVKLLKLFGLDFYFNYQKILVFKTKRKAEFVKPMGKTLFIDDDPIQLEDVKKVHGIAIDVLDRASFTTWLDIL